MRIIKTGLFMSLDGVVDADNDWQFDYFDGELFAWIDAAWRSSDTVLLGGRSFAGYDRLHDEHPDSPALAFLERVERYVVSRTTDVSTWPGTATIRENAYQRVNELRARATGEDILVPGSPTLVRWLIAQGLLDELNIAVLPIIVGGGPRLFPPDTGEPALSRHHLTLGDLRRHTNGVLQLHYLPSKHEAAATATDDSSSAVTEGV